jgi:uncharacterized repeat protein (TIGR01451 family)
VTVNPTFYTAVGQIITYTYTITNTGSRVIDCPIIICDSRLGSQLINYVCIPQCGSCSYNRTYTISNQDLTVSSLTNEVVAFIQLNPKAYVYTQSATVTITYGSSDLFGTITQTLTGGGTGATVTITITNSSSSLTDAYGVNLVLNNPANVPLVVAGSAILPATAPIINPTNVTISEALIPIGTTYTYQFNYFPSIIPASYNWSGTITSSSYESNTTNNSLSSTFTFPAIP